MKVSIVIPARNAEATLAETLESVLAQEHADWETVVVNDGSTDGTADVIRRFATADARIRSLDGPEAGVGAARNEALKRAMGEAILFLDADDWILPHHLSRLTAPLADPAVDGAFGGWARVAADGTIFDDTLAGDPETLFVDFARTCIWAIHSVVVRKERILEAGGFRTDWKTCEDWDLWQRLTRAGARFTRVPGRVALYRMTPGSASMDDVDLVRNGLAVVDQGHRPDPRVERPAPAWESGLPEAGRAEARLCAVLWAAGMRIGGSKDPLELLELVRGEEAPGLDPWIVFSTTFKAPLLPRAEAPKAWWDLWPTREERILRFLEAVEAHTGAPFLARRVRVMLEAAVAGEAPADAEGRVGSTRLRTVDILEPIPDLPASEDVRCLVVRARRGESDLGPVPIAARSPAVPGAVVADRIAREHLWKILAAHYGDAPGAGPIRAVSEAASRLGDLLPHRRRDMEEWAVNSASRLAALREIAPRRTAPSIRVTVGRVALEITDPLPDVRTDARTLVVRVLLGGEPLKDVTVPTRDGAVTAAALRRTLLDGLGPELLVAAVRDGILGRAPGRLGDVLRRRAAERRGALPEAGSPDSPAPPVIDAAPRARRALDVAARLAERGIPGLRERRGDRAIADRLPILMFHRVADEGAEATAPWRVPVRWFESLLDALESRGYRTVTLEQWRAARERRRQLHGRPILLTFDDAYVDFAAAAWPRLRARGFGAHVFVVTDRAGGTNEWDRRFGETLPLLGWDELRRLAREGVRFGSHTVTHVPLTGVSRADAVREMMESRERLERELGARPDAIAYPYGDVDPVVRQLAADCGYAHGLTCIADVARYGDDPMALPRFLADPRESPASLLTRMERRWGSSSG